MLTVCFAASGWDLCLSFAERLRKGAIGDHNVVNILFVLTIIIMRIFDDMLAAHRLHGSCRYVCHLSCCTYLCNGGSSYVVIINNVAVVFKKDVVRLAPLLGAADQHCKS